MKPRLTNRILNGIWLMEKCWSGMMEQCEAEDDPYDTTKGGFTLKEWREGKSLGRPAKKFHSCNGPSRFRPLVFEPEDP
jgi:hypothetical protein